MGFVGLFCIILTISLFVSKRKKRKKERKIKKKERKNMKGEKNIIRMNE